MLGQFDTPGVPPEQLLHWYLEAGVDETIGDIVVDRFAQAKLAAQPKAPVATALSTTVPAPAQNQVSGQGTSAHLALACETLDQLRAAMEAYDGCNLKKSCQRMVFADGNPKATLMLIGEAPGAEEDQQGRPFVGASGHLLNRMLASIGLDRADVYITNVVPWRPPGNRKPEPTEVELCLPFIQRHIELIDPQCLILLGGAAAAALLARAESISRLRGRWMDYSSPRLPRPLATMPTYHPAYLLRTPLQKREAWADFLAVRKKLDGIA